MKSLPVMVAISDIEMRQTALEQINELCSKVQVQDPRDWQAVLFATTEIQPAVVVLELEPVSHRFDEAIRELKSCYNRVKIVVVHPTSDPTSILIALRGGAHEFVHEPLRVSLVPAVERLLVPFENETTGARNGKVIGFLSAKGGCGSTTIACHVAVYLQSLTSKKVLLADLDLDSGMVGFLMKADKRYSILDAIENLSRLDESLWKALTVETKHNVTVIPAPQLFTREQFPNGDDLRGLLRFMRAHYDWTVLDLGRSLNTIVSELYEQIDQILLVSVLEVTALHGLKTIVRRLTDCGQDLDRLQLVINRTPKMMEMTTDELAKILGRPLYGMLPNDYPSLYQSYSNGNLLANTNALAQQMSLLSGKIAGVQPPKPKKRFSLFS